MKLTRLIAGWAAFACALALTPVALAQTQPLPAANNVAGSPDLSPQAVVPCVAPSGGGGGACRYVADDKPLPVQMRDASGNALTPTASQAAAGSDATKATAVQGITGGTPIHTALVDSTGAVVDVSQNAIVSGAIQITNSGSVRTASLQQNKGSDDLSNTGSDSAAYLEGRAYLHAYDPVASTWSRLKAGKIAGLVTSPYGLPSETWLFAAPNGGIQSDTSDQQIVAATTGKTNCLTSLNVSWGTLSGVSEFIIKDGGGSVRFRDRLDTTSGRLSPPLSRPICASAANLSLVYALGASVTGKVYVDASGVTQ